jgi:putative ABC transport system substrate-binding protein
MDRRRFLLTSLAGALAAPLPSEAQSAKAARIGYLSFRSAAVDSAYLQAFRQGLRDVGYVEGQNAALEVRYADGNAGRLPALCAELIRSPVDVIVAAPTPAIRAAKKATQTIPIVMAFSSDPVAEDIVASLARPGGNITGLSTTASETSAKRIEFLKALVPTATQIGYLADAVTSINPIRETEAAGRALGVEVRTILVRNASELNAALSTLTTSRMGGLIVSLSLQESWRQIARMALKSRLPTVSGPPEFVEAGGLMAYGPQYPDLFRRAATYVDRILKGARPGDLPIEQPTKFELVLSLKTATALGLTIPPSLLARADRVIE